MSQTPAVYLVRHASTEYSRRFLVNGLRLRAVPIDDAGRAACVSRALLMPWLATVASIRTSSFRRTQETALLLTAGRSLPSFTDPRLDELDYGSFEGGTWLAYGDWLRSAGPTAVVPGGESSWADCVSRMLDGLFECLEHPMPQLVVCHGLLLSLLLELRSHGEGLRDLWLPGVDCLTVLPLAKSELEGLVVVGRKVLRHLREAAESTTISSEVPCPNASTSWELQ